MVTSTTTTVNAWQLNMTGSLLVLQIQLCTDEELFTLRLTKLTNMHSCPLVLYVEWPWDSPFYIKAISLSAFLSSPIVSCKGGQRNIFKQPGTLKFPPKPGRLVCSLLTFVVFVCMKAHNRERPFSKIPNCAFFSCQKQPHRFLWFMWPCMQTDSILPSFFLFFLLWCPSNLLMTLTILLWLNSQGWS